MELKQEVSFLGVFSLATGSMISSGIFILPSLAFINSGPASSISYFLAGMLALIGVQSIIELSTAMPKAGGDYYFINRSLGPMIGTISGLLGWVAISLKSAFAVFGISEVIFLITGTPVLISGALITLFFVLLNIFGVKEATRLQIILVFFLLLLMAFFVIIGIPKIETSHFIPFAPNGYNKILYTSGFVFVSFGGLLKVANIAEEVKDPKKNIPLGMITSVIVVTILYALSVIITTGVLTSNEFSTSLTPIADAANKIIGYPGFIVITIAASLAFITTANAGLLAASRYPLSLARDGLLPKVFCKTSKKGTVPIVSIIVTGIIIFSSLLIPLDSLVKAASTVILTSYVLTNLSVIVLRESHLANYKPSYKSPLYPYVQILSIIVFSYFIIQLGTNTMGLSLLFLFLCFMVYLFYGRKHFSGDFAIIHVIKRMMDERITENFLEDELREIVINRDNIEQDDFDTLVKKAKVYDIDHSINFDSLLSITVEDIARHVNLDEAEIYRRFNERQAELSTALTPFIAVPHIITDDDSEMFLTLVRCKDGIKFSDDEDSIKAAFLFGGPSDMRTFHLKILSSIAEIASEENFPDMWIAAKNEDDLKNLFVLNSRKR
ncbi:MAG: amino acid permease [Sphaerochaetaceae bacterium]|nr:amino acid permease [Sphaerochaetaceae bacterium]MDC7236353.1 amino acid permease [Sphaerochaetaceae bacterium]MDC7249195.1 amino acid permease [Sphaerochaetaceae bacterium]